MARRARERGQSYLDANWASGSRQNAVTESAEHCDVCFSCFLQGSLNPKKKWKTKQLTLPHVLVVGSALSREARVGWTLATCHQDRQLFSPLQRAGGRHCVHQGHLVCGRVGHRPSAGRPLVGSGLMCFEPPGGLCGGGGGHETCAQKRVRNSYQVRRHHTVLTQSNTFPPSLPPAPCFPPSPSEICTCVELDSVAQLLICHRRPPTQDPGPDTSFNPGLWQEPPLGPGSMDVVHRRANT